MHLPSFIARRYLFSKAHRNVINIISIVSAAAIGVGCMALIVILSVYNGFNSLVESSYNSYTPEYIISPLKGKTINLSDERIGSVLDKVNKASLPYDKVQVFPVLKETVYVQYDIVQSIAKIKGVPPGYESLSRLQFNTISGDFVFSFGGVPRAVVEENLAVSLMLKPQFATSLEIYLPSRTEDISLLMPASSLLSQEIRPSGIISLWNSEDNGTIYIPDNLARELMEYEDKECSEIELFFSSNVARPDSAKEVSKAEKTLIREIRSVLGEDFVIKDRYQQNETLYKMMKAEKFAIYMILLFVTIVISVNLLASLSLLIIEKEDDIKTYQAMGMHLPTIRRSFTLQGWLICMTGAVAGVVLGLILCWVQYQWRVIPLPGNFAISYYPVVVKVSDVLLTLLSVAAIGFLMAYIPARSIREKQNK